ncbi:endospore germination permease [Alteribacillus sp. HJP-4]|uniref:GerAB/ArcD/ProY family transporter n=1 Tax=Alteribacillus sp. HJP-4 TaxID=2775394 RepID=UPI0035CD1923
MQNQEKIDVAQFTLLVVLFTIGSAIIYIPPILAVSAMQDAWLSAFAGLLVGLLSSLLLVRVSQLYPDLTLAEYCERILGKWAGKLAALWFISFAFLLAALNVRNMGEFMSSQILYGTPFESIHFIFICVVVFGARLGIEVLGRAAELVIPFVLFFIFVIIVSVLPEAEWNNLKPFLAEGMRPVFAGAFQFAGFPFFELVIFLMVFPFVNQSHKAGKGFMVGVITGAAVLLVLTTLSIAVLGAEESARIIYPVYMLTKRITIGGFIERIEAVVAGIWMITIYFKLSICFYAASFGIKNLLNLKDYRPLLLPLALIMLILSVIIYPNIIYLATFTERYWTLYSGTAGLLIPLILLVVAKIRRIGSFGD